MTFRRGFAILLLATALAAPLALLVNARDSAGEAQREYNAGHYARVVDLLTAAVAKSPEEAPLHFMLGQCFYQLRDYTRAVTSFEKSVSLSPKESEYHDWLGKAYGRRAEESMFISAMGWAKKTHKEFETAVQLNPSNFEAQRDLIRFEMFAPGIVNGGDERALKHIEALEKIDELQGLLARGEFFNAKKRVAEADKVFEKILESNTDRIGVYFEVADYYRDRRMPAKMEQAVDAAARIDAADRRLKYYRAILFIVNEKNPGEAESLLQSYLNTVPDNVDLPSHASAQEWLGRLYQSQSRFSEATEAYRRSLALDPHNKAVEEDLKRVRKN